MVWKALEKENAHDVLDKLSGDEQAVVFSKRYTKVSAQSLSFYPNFDIYRLINYATMPSFSMEYLSNGDVFIPLDGTANPIYAINAEAPIQLMNDNIIEYLDFFFTHVHGADGDIYLIKNPNKMPALSSLDAGQQQAIIDSYVPITVNNGAVSGHFTVHATVYYSGCLISSDINITDKGRIVFENRQMLLRGIRFPQTEVNYYWMGEK